MRRITILALAVGALCLLSASVHQSEAAEGKWGMGVYAGMYKPGPEVMDDGGTFGLRLGYSVTDHVVLSGSLGMTSLEADEGELDNNSLSGDIDTDTTLLDLDAFWIFAPEKKFSFTAGGGIGWAWTSADVNLKGPNKARLEAEDLTEDSFTANIAMGPAFRLGKDYILRLMPRLRYFENRDNDEYDFETTIMFGWTFGG